VKTGCKKGQRKKAIHILKAFSPIKRKVTTFGDTITVTPITIIPAIRRWLQLTQPVADPEVSQWGGMEDNVSAPSYFIALQRTICL